MKRGRRRPRIRNRRAPARRDQAAAGHRTRHRRRPLRAAIAKWTARWTTPSSARSGMAPQILPPPLRGRMARSAGRGGRAKRAANACNAPAAPTSPKPSAAGAVDRLISFLIYIKNELDGHLRERGGGSGTQSASAGHDRALLAVRRHDSAHLAWRRCGSPMRSI